MTEQKRRRIMRDFVIRELGAVDRPAQAPAVAVLMKRADDPRKEQDDMQKQMTYARDIPTSFATLDDAINFLMAQQGYTRLNAMTQAANQNPDLVAKYQREGEQVAKAAADEVAKVRAAPPAVAAFEKRVGEVMGRDKVGRLSALEKAQAEFPDEFEAYQSA